MFSSSHVEVINTNINMMCLSTYGNCSESHKQLETPFYMLKPHKIPQVNVGIRPMNWISKSKVPYKTIRKIKLSQQRNTKTVCNKRLSNNINMKLNTKKWLQTLWNNYINLNSYNFPSCFQSLDETLLQTLAASTDFTLKCFINIFSSFTNVSK